MKSPVIIPGMLLAACFFTACSKKDSSANIATPDITHQTAATVNQLSIPAYPYTDTFAGSMAVAFRDFGSDYDSTNKNYRFYVTHMSESILFVRGVTSIQLELYSGIINIADSVVIQPNNAVDSGDMCLFPYEHHNGQVVKNGIAFQMSGTKLFVNWDIFGVPLLGACDEGESIGNFTGSLVRKSR